MYHAIPYAITIARHVLAQHQTNAHNVNKATHYHQVHASQIKPFAHISILLEQDLVSSVYLQLSTVHVARIR